MCIGKLMDRHHVQYADPHTLNIARQTAIDAEEARQYSNQNRQARLVRPAEAPATAAQIGQLFGIRDERFIRMRLNPFVFYKHVPLALLTDQAESYDNLKIGWSFSNGQFNSRRGIVSSKDLIKNIIGMRISTGRYPWASMSSVPYQRQIFILVEEFAQFAMRNSLVAYHFIMTPDASGHGSLIDQQDQYANYVPSFDGYFWFPAPVQDLNTITLQFSTSNLTFDARRVPTLDQITPTNPEYKSNPMELPFPDDGTVLVDGQTYYFPIATLTSGDPTITSQITSQDGLPITFTAPGYFSIPVDGSTVTSFTVLYVWATPAVAVDFSVRLDLIYLGDQDQVV